MVGFKTVIVIILNKSEGDRYDKYSISSSDRMWICRSIYGVQPGAERIVFRAGSDRCEQGEGGRRGYGPQSWKTVCSFHEDLRRRL